MKQVLVFELNNYHTETFPIYANLLPDLLGDDVHISYYVDNAKHEELSRTYANLSQLYPRWLSYLLRKLQLQTLFFKKKIQRLIDETAADVVVLNSIEPERNFDLFREIRAPQKIAVLHNPARAVYKELEALPHEHYYVISDVVYASYRESLPLEGYFLPFFSATDVVKNAPENKIRIGIQGLIDYRRRDYAFILELAKALKQMGVNHVEFDIIGSLKSPNPRGAKRLQASIKAEGLENYFILHPTLNDQAFMESVASCTYLMTALTEHYDFYYRNKTTAALSHAATLGIPLILSADNASAWNMDGSNALVFNDVEGLMGALSRHDTAEYSKLCKTFSQYISEKILSNREMLKGLNWSRP